MINYENIYGMVEYWNDGKMGLEPVEIILLALTFLVRTVNFVTGRTTVLRPVCD
jgi:hypothetical protein